MYRFLSIFLIVVLVNFSEAGNHRHRSSSRHDECEGKRCRDWNTNDHGDILLQQIGRELINVDRKAQEFCKHKNSETEEFLGQEKYKLIVPLKDYADGNVTVKAKHRAVYIRVEKLSNGDKKQILEDVKIIPEVVDLKQAKWKKLDGNIELYAPYKIKFNEAVQRSCNNFDFNYNVYEIPSE